MNRIRRELAMAWRGIQGLSPTSVRARWAVRNRPRVQIETGPWVPGWALRVGLIALALGSGLVVAKSPLLVVGLIAVVVFLLVRSVGLAPAFFAIWCGVALTFSTPGWGWQTHLLLLVAPMVLQLGASIGHTAFLARYEWAALLPAALRVAVIQLIVQPLAALGGWLATRELSIPGTPLVAGLGLVLLTYGWVSRLRRAR